MTIDKLEEAVAELPPDDFTRFRAWFDQFDAVRFDETIERDDDFRKNCTREL